MAIAHPGGAAAGSEPGSAEHVKTIRTSSVISKFESYRATTLRLSEIQSALTPTPAVRASLEHTSPQGGRGARQHSKRALNPIIFRRSTAEPDPLVNPSISADGSALPSPLRGGVGVGGLQAHR